MINIFMLRGVVKKKDNIHEQVGNFSREMGTIKTSQIEMSEFFFFFFKDQI